MGNEMDSYAKQIAKASALIHRADHSYLPQTAEEFIRWEPHAWVVGAIEAAARESNRAINSALCDSENIRQQLLRDQGKAPAGVVERLRRILRQAEKGTVSGIGDSDEEAINLAIEYMEVRL